MNDTNNEDEFSAEAEVYAEQERIIKEKFGEEAANKANYGWGATEGSIATKIYGKEPTILVTDFNADATSKEELKMEHDFQPYNSPLSS